MATTLKGTHGVEPHDKATHVERRHEVIGEASSKLPPEPDPKTKLVNRSRRRKRKSNDDAENGRFDEALPK